MSWQHNLFSLVHQSKMFARYFSFNKIYCQKLQSQSLLLVGLFAWLNCCSQRGSATLLILLGVSRMMTFGWAIWLAWFLREIVLAKILLIASITIDDVVYAIDCGKAKETSYDALNRPGCLLPSWISKASAPLNDGLIGNKIP